MTTTDPTTRPKLEAVVTLPEGGGQVWVRFVDGVPYADHRPAPSATWLPVEFVGGSVVVAP